MPVSKRFACDAIVTPNGVTLRSLFLIALVTVLAIVGSTSASAVPDERSTVRSSQALDENPCVEDWHTIGLGVCPVDTVKNGVTANATEVLQFVASELGTTALEYYTGGIVQGEGSTTRSNGEKNECVIHMTQDFKETTRRSYGVEGRVWFNTFSECSLNMQRMEVQSHLYRRGSWVKSSKKATCEWGGYGCYSLAAGEFYDSRDAADNYRSQHYTLFDLPPKWWWESYPSQCSETSGEVLQCNLNLYRSVQ